MRYRVPRNIWAAFKKDFQIIKQIRGHPSTNGYCNDGIYLVRERDTEDLCIMKIFTPRDISKGYAKREIDALRYLESPTFNNINQFVKSHVDYTNEEGALVVRFCDQGTLADLIKKRQRRDYQYLTEQFIWHVFQGLTNALRYMNEGPEDAQEKRWNVVLHRDISPANVFLSTGPSNESFPRVVLGDFGCSVNVLDVKRKSADPHTVERQNRKFAPPEAPYYYRNSDVYQVGIVVLCLCALETDVSAMELKDNFDDCAVSGFGYSDRLAKVLTLALRTHTSDRIGPVELWKLVKEKAPAPV